MVLFPQDNIHFSISLVSSCFLFIEPMNLLHVPRNHPASFQAFRAPEEWVFSYRFISKKGHYFYTCICEIVTRVEHCLMTDMSSDRLSLHLFLPLECCRQLIGI